MRSSPAVVLVAIAGIGAGCGDRRRARDDAAVAAAPADAGAAVIDAAPAPVRDEHAAWSLGDNLLMAHRTVRGDLVVDAGSVGFARYTQLDRPLPRWRRAQLVDGHRAAIAPKGGGFDLPLTAEQAASAHALLLELVAERAGEVRVKLNATRAVTVPLEPGRRWYPVATDPGAWRAGDNTVQLDRAVALAQVRVTSDATAAAAEGDPAGRVRWEASRRAVVLGRDAGLTWYLQLPAGVSLRAPVTDAACRVEVAATADDGTVARGALGGDQDRVDLAAVGGRAVRVDLVARGCEQAELVDPAFVVPGPPPPPVPSGPPARYVVLWVFDALRADRVRPFQPGARAEVPNFDELAKTSAVFRQYYVGGNESQVSHATVWTGVYPSVHDVRPVGDGGSWRLPRELPVLGELVKAGGLTPIAVTGNGFVLNEGGYGRGFAEYRNMMREKGIMNATLYGADVVAHAKERMTARKDEPFLQFIGTVDTHGPWIARKPWIDTYSPGYRGPFLYFARAKELGIIPGQMGCQKVPAQPEIDRLRAIYDSAISYHDERLGDLVAHLKELGIYDQTMIVLTADHGEELFEDGRCGHGGSQRESLLRVPLMIHYPPRIAPSVIDVGAEGVDVLPTILATIGAPIPDGLQGEPLHALAAGVGRDWPRPSYATQFEYAHTLRVGRWKLKAGKRGAPRLVDLVADPEETVDVAGANPIARRAMTDALGLFLANRERWHKASMGVVTNLAPRASELLEGR